jgi:FAD-dependent oxidoreductase domain-containing protein 1
MTQRNGYDVVIVGGGVIGSATAYFLAADSDFDGTVAVVERDPTYEFSTSARSMASIRQQFSTPENIAISRFGYGFLKSVGETLAVKGEPPDIQFRDGQYLFFIEEHQKEAFDAVLAIQHANGAEVERIDGGDAVKDRFDWVNTEDLVGAQIGLSREGWFDGYALTMAFRRKAIDLGVTYLQDEAVGFGKDGARITHVEIASGERLPAGQVVNSSGRRARWTAELAGIHDLPVSPRKRCVFYCDCREPVPQGLLVIDSSGVYFRGDGQGFLCGRSPGPDEPDPECHDFDVDYSQFEEYIWPALAHRVPAFEAIRQSSAWGCHYAMSLLDANAILGPHPELTNFHFANGFSGHGMQQSPAVGRGLAEMIAHGEYRSLDLSVFGYERVRSNTPIVETGVI